MENSDGSGAVNFLTGMGGFLQAIFFGYAGFRYKLGEEICHIFLPNQNRVVYQNMFCCRMNGDIATLTLDFPIIYFLAILLCI